MKQKSYAELLKDPRWQKKRLEIMQRDNFTCQHCLATGKSLQVHHLVYEKGKKPWEYEDDELITLCENCHQEETEKNFDLYNDFQSLSFHFKESGISLSVLSKILSYITETLYGIKYKCEDDYYNEPVKKLILFALYDIGSCGDLIRAYNMGIDVSEYVEKVFPEIKDKLIKQDK